MTVQWNSDTNGTYCIASVLISLSQGLLTCRNGLMGLFRSVLRVRVAKYRKGGREEGKEREREREEGKEREREREREGR